MAVSMWEQAVLAEDEAREAQIVAESDSPAGHIRNAMTVLAIDVRANETIAVIPVESLRAVERRMLAALRLLEAK